MKHSVHKTFAWSWIALLLIVVLSGCSGDQVVNHPPSEDEEVNPVTIEDRAQAAIQALKNKDFQQLAHMVDPDKGVLFSPYAYVNLATAQVFTAEQLKEVENDQTVYNWGYRDGTGESIQLTFVSYYEEFIYDADFANAEQISYNERIGLSNTLDNIAEVFPNATVVEFHFSGFDEQYEGLDWRSLRLVFEPKDDTWYLVAVVHDQWTT